jgi:hypothetical protein
MKMTDTNLMEADCVHGIVWYECSECMTYEPPPLPPHPAKFTDKILEVIGDILIGEQARLDRRIRVFDPFAGTGLIHRLHDQGKIHTFGYEIEPEWAAYHNRTVAGNSLHVAAKTGWFDVIATSCCVIPEMRVLTADLRWVPAGDLVAGDKLLTFDEMSPFTKMNGNAARRKFSWGEVIESRSTIKRCVRVILGNGDEIITTYDHPWLAHRSKGYSTQEWIEAKDLSSRTASNGSQVSPMVLQQFRPWREHRSRDAGWLAGMFDGEGSLTYGEHGTPRMSLCQALGPVNDYVEQTLTDLKIPWNQILRAEVSGSQRVMNTYVSGGWSNLVETLGSLRPIRLLNNFTNGDISSRTIQPERIPVIAVEEVGDREIQSLTTSTGTFICEGYLHHNTYGNRMADHHVAKDSSKRMTYTHQLGRPLSENNSGAMNWGPKYWDFHIAAWREQTRILKPGGLFILNVKDFYRTRTINRTRVTEQVEVCQWHLDTLTDLGYQVEREVIVPVRGMRMGANHKKRMGHEMVYALRRS